MRLFTITSTVLLSSCFALSLAGCGSGDTSSGTTGGAAADAPTEITFADGSVGQKPRFSPDSAKIVCGKALGDTAVVAVMDPAGGQVKTIAESDNFLDGATWTPDGKQVYFASGAGISVVAAEGGTPTVAVNAFAALDPDVSPDGKSLVYGTNGGALQLVDLATPTMPKALGAMGTSPRFSPDGKSIAFESSEHIKTMEIATGTVTDIVDAGTYLASVDWFADGKRLAITSDKGIEIVTLGATPTRAVVREEFAADNLDLSPDGKSIVYGVNGQKSLFVLKGF
jgi:Tol biopolymer transport system component